MPRVRYSSRAKRDLLDIWAGIARENVAAADRLYARIEARVAILQQFPLAGVRRPDIAPSARMLVEPPYLILYRVIPDGAQVVRIRHGARRTGGRAFQIGLD